MSAITQIIRDISATGAKFVINENGIGLDRTIPVELLSLAKQNKDAIRLELEAQQRREGIRNLRLAAQGLKLNFEELARFFEIDLMDFGNGAVSMAGIRKAAEWFAYTYPAWRAAQ